MRVLKGTQDIPRLVCRTSRLQDSDDGHWRNALELKTEAQGHVVWSTNPRSKTRFDACKPCTNFDANDKPCTGFGHSFIRWMIHTKVIGAWKVNDPLVFFDVFFEEKTLITLQSEERRYVNSIRMFTFERESWCGENRVAPKQPDNVRRPFLADNHIIKGKTRFYCSKFRIRASWNTRKCSRGNIRKMDVGESIPSSLGQVLVRKMQKTRTDRQRTSEPQVPSFPSFYSTPLNGRKAKCNSAKEKLAKSR
jgi:hypothetical protein